MAGKTGIQWTDSSWNPLTGCARVTAGCDHCYAFELHDMRHAAYIRDGGVYQKNGRAMPVQYSKPFSEIQLIPERLTWPLHQKQPLKVFVNSMSDLFHSEVPDEYIRQVLEVMRPETNGAAFIRDTGIETAWYHIVNGQKPYRVGYKKSARAKAKYFDFQTEEEAKGKIDQLFGEY